MNIIIITHENLGQAYVHLVQHFFGALPDFVHIIAVAPDAEPDVLYSEISTLLTKEKASGSLLLSDIFGATPCNIARRLLTQPNMVLLTGVNAPMVVKAVQDAPQTSDVHDLAEKVQAAAIKGIMRVDALEEA